MISNKAFANDEVKSNSNSNHFGKPDIGIMEKSKFIKK